VDGTVAQAASSAARAAPPVAMASRRTGRPAGLVGWAAKRNLAWRTLVGDD